MKNVLTAVCTAVLVAVGIGEASPGPFVGVEVTWGWPCLNFGYDSGLFKGWLTKYEPLILSGWWGAGFEGRWRIAEVFPNMKVAGGARMAILWEGWKAGGPEAKWYWGPSLGLSWDWGPYQIYVRGLLPIPVRDDAPLLGVALSAGVDINLDFVWGKLFPPG